MAQSVTVPEGAPEGAPALHFESYVFDYSPLGEPFIMTPATEAAVDGALEAGQDVGVAVRAISEARKRELATDPAVRELVRRVWRASGVNGVQVSLGATFMSQTFDCMLKDIAHWNQRVEVGGDMAVCRTADELESAAAEDKVGLLLGTQDCPIGDDMSKLELLAGLGVRVIQLTFNTRNHIGDGCTERNPAGLSRFGIEVVHRMNELGVLVDTSHCSWPTTADAIEFCERPPVITHATCHAVTPHPRAKSDEHLQALADKDGYFGVDLVPFYLAPGGGATVEMLVDHIEHAAKLVGVERVGIGTDWGLWSPDFPERLKAGAHDKIIKKAGKFEKKDAPDFRDKDKNTVAGFGAWEHWSNITAALLQRFGPAEVQGIIGGNWLAYLRRAGL